MILLSALLKTEKNIILLHCFVAVVKQMGTDNFTTVSSFVLYCFCNILFPFVFSFFPFFWYIYIYIYIYYIYIYNIIYIIYIIYITYIYIYIYIYYIYIYIILYILYTLYILHTYIYIYIYISEKRKILITFLKWKYFGSCHYQFSIFLCTNFAFKFI